MLCRYLGFLARALFPLQDAGIHGLNVFYHQTKELIREAEGQLHAERRRVRNPQRDVSIHKHVIFVPRPAARWDHLLADAEGLVVEVLDELAGHQVRVVRVAVRALLLQEVDLHGHGADALFGPVEVVVCHCDGENCVHLISAQGSSEDGSVHVLLGAV